LWGKRIGGWLKGGEKRGAMGAGVKQISARGTGVLKTKRNEGVGFQTGKRLARISARSEGGGSPRRNHRERNQKQRGKGIKRRCIGKKTRKRGDGSSKIISKEGEQKKTSGRGSEIRRRQFGLKSPIQQY